MELHAIENKALSIIKSLQSFSWQSFERHFLSNRSANNKINEAYTIYINEQRKSGNLGTAESYECAERSLEKFAANTKFGEVTPDFLKKYEKWMLTQGRSITTVGIYLRTLRHFSMKESMKELYRNILTMVVDSVG